MTSRKRSRSKSKKILKKLEKGTLAKFGYNTSDPKDIRRKVLKKAIKKFGYYKLIKRLEVLKMLTKRTNPNLSKIYSNDTKYLLYMSPKKRKSRSYKSRSYKPRSYKPRSYKPRSYKSRSSI